MVNFMFNQDPHKGSQKKSLVVKTVRETHSGCLLGTVLGFLVLVCGISVTVLAGIRFLGLLSEFYVFVPGILIVFLGVKLLFRFIPTTSRIEYEVTRQVK